MSVSVEPTRAARGVRSRGSGRAVTVRGASSFAEVRRAYELAARLFGPNSVEASRTLRAQLTLEPVTELQDVVVAASGRELVGMVRLVDRRLLLQGRPIPTAGVTSVCVHPDFRDQGIGRRLMEAALERVWRRRDALSVLFARRASDGFYPKFGYVGVGCHPQLSIEPRDVNAVKTRAPHVRCTRGPLRAQLPRYASLYNEAYGQVTLAFHRDTAWWRAFMARSHLHLLRVDFVNVWFDSTLIGYCVFHEETVVEASYAPGQQDAFCHGLVTTAAAYGHGGVRAALPLDHPLMGRLRSLSHVMCVRLSWEGGHMARIIDLARLGEIVGQDRVVERNDVRRHEDAQVVLLRLAGVNGGMSSRRLGEGVGSPPLFPVLPTWSIVDEF